MSGICGILHLNGKPVEPLEIETMMKPMTNWGPDGINSSNNGAIAFGHFMLFNTPESHYEKNPLKDPTTGRLIVSNSRIDNREELFNTLQFPNSGRLDIPDSQLLLKCYDKWGEDCSNHILGDWCFALWDPAKNKLFISRDHHGLISLYYYCSNQSFYFASSMKAFLAIQKIPKELNELKLAQCIVTWREHGAETIYKNIYRLPSSNSLTVQDSKPTIKRYWFLEKTPQIRFNSDDDYISAFRDILFEAVKCRIRKTDSVGIMLSGGYDSGSIAAIAAQELIKKGHTLKAFSAIPKYDVSNIFPKQYFGDESPFIKDLAEHVSNIDINFNHSETLSPLNGIQISNHSFEEPCFNAVNSYWHNSILKQAKDAGINTLLTGQGGNATLSWKGLNMKKGIDFWEFYQKSSQLNNQEIIGNMRLIKQHLLAPMQPEFLKNKRHRFKTSKTQLYSRSPINLEFAEKIHLYDEMKNRNFHRLTRVIPGKHEPRHWMLNPGRSTRGGFMNKTGAHHGLNIVSPFLDKRIIEFCLSIPNEQYYNKGVHKLLARNTMEGILPKSILWNAKKGIQAGDIEDRLKNSIDEINEKIQEISCSPLCQHFLDISKIRDVSKTIGHNYNMESYLKISSILMRGLMVGDYLLQYNKQSSRY